MSDGRVGRDSREAVRSSAFESYHKLAQRRRFSLLSVNVDQMKESLPDGVDKQGLLGAFLLLFEDDEWFRERRADLAQLACENIGLCVLASKAEDGRTCDIGIIDI